MHRDRVCAQAGQCEVREHVKTHMSCNGAEKDCGLKGRYDTLQSGRLVRMFWRKLVTTCCSNTLVYTCKIRDITNAEQISVIRVAPKYIRTLKN